MAEVNQSATLEAVKQGVDVASIPYVLKMADFSAVITDGKINTEKLTETVKKVLDDVPALKRPPITAQVFRKSAVTVTVHQTVLNQIQAFRQRNGTDLIFKKGQFNYGKHK